MTHTPGPWVVFVDRGSDSMIFSVLPAMRAGEIANNIENGPDADLISAAPDLLHALQVLLGYEGTGMKFSDRWSIGRQAIEKATGKPLTPDKGQT